MLELSGVGESHAIQALLDSCFRHKLLIMCLIEKESMRFNFNRLRQKLHFDFCEAHGCVLEE